MARDGGVLCRYFFQETFAEDECAATGAPLESTASSLMLSAEPTLAELRRKFPFVGQYHFRLQHAAGGNGGNGAPPGKSAYCWMDLRDDGRVLPVGHRGDILVKVLQVSPDPATGEDSQEPAEVPEDEQFAAYFRSQQTPKAAHQRDPSLASGYGAGGTPPPSGGSQDVAGVLFGVKKALASKMKQSTVAQSIQKQSARMWEKVVSVSSGGVGVNAPPTAAALEQLAKLVGAMKAPLSESNREHVDLLKRLWTCCFENQPFVMTGPGWERMGFRYGDPMRELQFLLPLQCLMFFHEVHRSAALPMMSDSASSRAPATYPYALVGSQITFVLADLLQLKDGGCLGAERPFWRLFEDPIAFYEVYSITLRAFDASWKMKASQSTEVGFHVNYAADFAQELLRRSPTTVNEVVELAYQMQHW